MPPAGFAAGGIDERGISRLAEGRQLSAADRGEDHPRLDPEWRSMRLPHRQERHLTDRRRHLRIGGCRCKGVAAAHRGAERRDPRRIDAIEAAGTVDRRGPVLELAPGLEQVRLTSAVAKPPMVEHECGDPRPREPLGKRAQTITARTRQAMGHDDRRRSPPRPAGIKPRRALIPVRPEPDLLAFHAYITSPGART